MKGHTPDFFPETVSEPPIARRSDPPTSKEAAHKIDQGGRDVQIQFIVELVTKTPGRTSREYSEILKRKGHDWYLAARMPSRRLSDACKRHLIFSGESRACTITGNKVRTYYPRSRLI